MKPHAKAPKPVLRLELHLSETGRKAVVDWLNDRVHEMRPDRLSITEEMNCDLVGVLQNLSEAIERVKL